MECSERSHRAMYDAAMAIVRRDPRLQCGMSWEEANKLRHLSGCCPFRELVPMAEAEIRYRNQEDRELLFTEDEKTEAFRRSCAGDFHSISGFRPRNPY